MRSYLPLQRALDEFGVLLRGAVAVTQLAVVPVPPAEDLPLRGEGQRVAVRALGGGDLLDGAVGLEGELLQRGLVVGVAQAQAAIAAFTAGPHGAIGRDHKGAVLARLDLPRGAVSDRGGERMSEGVIQYQKYT